MIVWGIGGLVLAALLVFGGWGLWLAAHDPYAGLTLTRETSVDDATRALLEQRIATTRASITALESAGEDVPVEMYESLAYDSYLMGDLVTARENYEIILNENPLYYVAWNSYANVLDVMGDYANADHAYLQAVEHAVDIDEYYLDYAKFLGARYTDRDEDQRLVLEQAVKVVGQTSALMVALAEWYTEHGDCDRAIAHYQVARTANPAAAESVDAQIAAARIACKATGSEE